MTGATKADRSRAPSRLPKRKVGCRGLGESLYRTADAAAAAGYSSIAGASAVREELIGKELIWSPRRGMIDFTVPRFAQYLRVTHAPGPAERDAPPL